jgi:hypothetical protein
MKTVKILKTETIKISPTLTHRFEQGKSYTVQENVVALLETAGCLKNHDPVQENKMMNPVFENKEVRVKRKYTRRKKVEDDAL